MGFMGIGNDPLINCKNNRKAIISSENKVDFYNLFLLFVIFSVMGFLYEGSLSIVKFGVMRHYQSVIYGPFSQIYGFGAIMAIWIFQKFADRGNVFLYFLFSILSGIYEYVSSLLDQYIFGFVAWDYSGRLLNINGRTTILYALEWGVLAMLIVKFLYPTLNNTINKLPKKIIVVVSWFLIIFLSLDMLITAAALERQSERHRNRPPENKFDVFLDNQYPDSFIKDFIPGLQFK